VNVIFVIKLIITEKLVLFHQTSYFQLRTKAIR